MKTLTNSLLTRPELAKALRISLDAVDRLVHSRTDPIPRFKAGRRYLFRLEEVLSHLRVDAPRKTVRSRRRGRGAAK